MLKRISSEAFQFELELLVGFSSIPLYTVMSRISIARYLRFRHTLSTKVAELPVNQNLNFLEYSGKYFTVTMV